MENTNNLIVALFSIMTILIVILIIALVFVVIYMIKHKNKVPKEETDYKEALRKKYKQPSPTLATGFCKNHKERHTQGVCSICEEEFCQECLKEIDKLNLCPEHFKTYVANIWSPITNEMTTAETPEKGVYIYNFKKKIWEDNQTPSYILNEYKINMEGDYIETYVQLYVTDKDKDRLIKKIELEKAN